MWCTSGLTHSDVEHIITMFVKTREMGILMVSQLRYQLKTEESTSNPVWGSSKSDFALHWSFFLRTSPAWSSPWRRCRFLPSGLRRWRKILQLLNMLFPPRWDEYEQFSCECEEMNEMDVFWWWHERDLTEFNMLIIMIMVHWVKIKQKLEWWKMVEWQ